MPSEKEIDEIVGDEKPSAPVVLSEEDFKNAVDDNPAPEKDVDYRKKYDELQKAYNKRDEEIREARLLKERLEAESEDEGESPKVPVLSDEEIERKVQASLQKIEAATLLKKEVEAAAAKYPFVDARTLLDQYVAKKRVLTINEIIKLNYSQELNAFEKSHNQDEAPVTDGGGRTLQTRQPTSDEHGDLKQGFRTSRYDENGFQRFISKALDKNLKKASGER